MKPKTISNSLPGLQTKADAYEILERCSAHIRAWQEARGLATQRVQRRPGGCGASSVEEYIRWQVEQHFRHYLEESKVCDELLTEFAEAHHRPEVCVQQGPSNPTLKIIENLDEKFGELFGWRSVVENTFRRFHGSPAGDVLEARFKNRLTARKAQEKLCMSPSSFYGYMATAMRYAMLIAARDNLLDLD